MAEEMEFGSDYANRQISRQRNQFRRRIKSFYVSRIIRHIDGPTVDIGCGAGQILERLPKGSMGIEVNPYLADELTRRGFRVRLVEACQSGLNLSAIKPNEFSNLVLSHVLEHFDNAHIVLRKLLSDCAQLGISKVIIVVPGKVGFRSDPTHKTFIDMDYLRLNQLDNCHGFKISHSSYFPGNVRFIGDFFIYHELMVVYQLI